jgi:septal ring factor EnvC (AmiA/AmiB activator)
MYQEVVTSVFDYKLVGLASVSVGLFLLNSVLQIFTKSKLESQQKTIEKTVLILESVEKSLADLNNTSKQAYKEMHEQWGEINDSARLLSENSLRIKDLTDSVDGIAQQQTVLATAQIQQNQNMQNVIDGLIEVLQDQAK